MRKHYLKTILLSLALILFAFTANAQSRIADEFRLGDTVTGSVHGKVFTGVLSIKIDEVSCVVKWANGTTDTSYYAYIHKKGTTVQTQANIYQTAVGGAADEYGTSVIATKDTGNIICGYLNLNTNPNVDKDSDPASGLLMKMDKNGNLVWMKSYGSILNDVIASDSGYISVGRYNADGIIKAYIVKTGRNGNMIWEKKIDNSAGSWAEGHSITQLYDQNFLVTGTTKSNNGNAQILVIKISGNGDILWQKNLGDNSVFTGIKSIDNINNLITVMGFGHFSKNDNDQVQLIQLDASGNQKWASQLRTKEVTRGYDMLYVRNLNQMVIIGDDNTFINIDEQGKTVSNDFKRNRHNGGGCLRKLFIVSDSLLGDAGVGAATSFAKNQGCLDIQPLNRKSTFKGYDKMYGNLINTEFYGASANPDNSITLVGFTTGFGGGGSDIYIVRVDRDGNTSAPAAVFMKQIKQNSKQQTGGDVITGGSTTPASPAYTQLLNNPNSATLAQYIDAVIATQDAISGQ
jgi:hypothetical protein